MYCYFITEFDLKLIDSHPLQNVRTTSKMFRTTSRRIQMIWIVLIVLSIDRTSTLPTLSSSPDKSTLSSCLPSQLHCGCEIRFDSATNTSGMLLSCSSLLALSKLPYELELLRRFADSQKHSLIAIQVSQASAAATWDLLEFVHSELTDQLRWLSLTNSNLQSDHRLDFSRFRVLEHLDLSNNNLTEVTCNWFPTDHLRYLDLSINSLINLTCDNFFQSFTQLYFLNIANNSLASIRVEPSDQVPISLIEAHVENNFWNCDKQLLSFISLVTAHSASVFRNSPIIRCVEPIDLVEMSFAQVSAINEADICNVCHCFSIRASLGVNCTARNLSRLPETLPLNTKVLFLDHNELESLQVPTNNLTGEPMPGWSSVIRLSAQHNKITSLQELEANYLKNLLTLNLSNNRLTDIPVHVLERLRELQELSLGGNPWDCDCNTVSFQQWLRTQIKVDMDRIRCADKRFKLPIYRIPLSELCPLPAKAIEWLDIFNVTFAFLTAFIVIKLVYDYFWQKRTGRLPQFFKINR